MLAGAVVGRGRREKDLATESLRHREQGQTSFGEWAIFCGQSLSQGEYKLSHSKAPPKAGGARSNRGSDWMHGLKGPPSQIEGGAPEKSKTGRVGRRNGIIGRVGGEP